MDEVIVVNAADVGCSCCSSHQHRKDHQHRHFHFHCHLPGEDSAAASVAVVVVGVVGEKKTKQKEWGEDRMVHETLPVVASVGVADSMNVVDGAQRKMMTMMTPVLKVPLVDLRHSVLVGIGLKVVDLLLVVEAGSKMTMGWQSLLPLRQSLLLPVSGSLASCYCCYYCYFCCCCFHLLSGPPPPPLLLTTLVVGCSWRTW